MLIFPVEYSKLVYSFNYATINLHDQKSVPNGDIPWVIPRPSSFEFFFFGLLFVFTIWAACLNWPVPRLYMADNPEAHWKAWNSAGIFLPSLLQNHGKHKKFGHNFNTITTILKAGKVSTYTTSCQKSSQNNLDIVPLLHCMYWFQQIPHSLIAIH